MGRHILFWLRVGSSEWPGKTVYRMDLKLELRGLMDAEQLSRCLRLRRERDGQGTAQVA